jgi:hypothetical protein
MKASFTKISIEFNNTQAYYHILLFLRGFVQKIFRQIDTENEVKGRAKDVDSARVGCLVWRRGEGGGGKGEGVGTISNICTATGRP